MPGIALSTTTPSANKGKGLTQAGKFSTLTHSNAQNMEKAPCPHTGLFLEGQWLLPGRAQHGVCAHCTCSAVAGTWRAEETVLWESSSSNRERFQSCWQQDWHSLWSQTLSVSSWPSSATGYTPHVWVQSPTLSLEVSRRLACTLVKESLLLMLLVWLKQAKELPRTQDFCCNFPSSFMWSPSHLSCGLLPATGWAQPEGSWMSWSDNMGTLKKKLNLNKYDERAWIVVP